MTDLLPLMTYCLVMSSTPGPNNVMLTASGANFGYRGALPQLFGISVGGFVQTWVMCMGLGQLFVRYPILRDGLRLAGTLYLLFLAWKLVGSSVAEMQSRKRVSFVEGLTFQMLNVKAWIKAVTLGSVFVPAGMDIASAALLVSVLSTLIGFPSCSMWALFGVALRGWLKNPSILRLFNLAMAGALLMLALSLLYES
jgi:threonine/homoserine/homoserine lactone efflux protein